MVELSASEALRLGVEAHKKGDERTAELYYLAILKTDPSNADANHNVGVLRLSRGQNLDALAYFEKALDTNNSVQQFWISVIDTLLKLERYNDALEKINLAQKHGLSDAQITYYRDKIEPNLNITEKNRLKSNKHANILQSIKLDHAFSLAQKKMRDGYTEEARSIYKDIIEKFPKNKRARAKLKLLNKDQSKTYLSDKLKKLFSLYTAGEYDAVLTQATNLRKKYGEEHALINLCAAANAALEKYDSAIKDYKKALKLNPNFYETFYNLGTIYQKLDMLDDAIAAYQNTLRLDPKNILASFNLANAFYMLGKLKDAASNYETTINLDPKYAEAHHNLGVTFQKMGKLEKSVECYQNALKIKPNYPEAIFNLANALQERGELEEAIIKYLDVIKLTPLDERVFHNLGYIYQTQGSMERAMNFYRKAFEIRPSYTEMHRHFSLLNRYSEDDQHLKQMEDLLEKATLSEEEFCHLHYALAKAYEDIKDYHSSFLSYKKGNALRKKILRYNLDEDRLLFEKLIKTSSVVREAECDLTVSVNNKAPIFILGMPRSGTSLVEQILSSHSKVFGGGELPFIRDLVEPFLSERDKITTQSISQLHQSYINKLSNIIGDRGGIEFITDKMPGNFMYIAFILAAFPHAKIIHVVRDPFAVCWSNYKTFFRETNGLGYSYNLDDLTSFYRMYKNLMKFWHNNYPNRIIDFSYEKLVTNREVEIQNLIKVLGLPWEDNCLEPHKNKRIVHTASQQQVRRKIYQDSSQKWKNFARYLDEPFKALL